MCIFVVCNSNARPAGESPGCDDDPNHFTHESRNNADRQRNYHSMKRRSLAEWLEFALFTACVGLLGGALIVITHFVKKYW
jgi:hypothetical protein